MEEKNIKAGGGEDSYQYTEPTAAECEFGRSSHATRCGHLTGSETELTL